MRLRQASVISEIQTHTHKHTRTHARTHAHTNKQRNQTDPKRTCNRFLYTHEREFPDTVSCIPSSEVIEGVHISATKPAHTNCQ